MVYGIIQGGEAGWASAEILAAFVAGAALLTAFALVEIKSEHPMLPFQYFKRMDFTGSFLVIMLLFVGMIGVFFFLTQYFQLVQDRSALVAGAAVTPVAGTMMIGAGISSKAVPRFGPKAVLVLSGLIIMSGMGVFSQIEVDTAYWVPILGVALFGLGAGIAMPTVTDTIMAAVPVNDAGIGSAMNDLSRELGIALGVAVLGSIVSSLYRGNVTGAVDGLVSPEAAGKIGDSLGSIDAITAGLSPAVAAAVSNAADQSFVEALNIGYFAAAGFVALALAVAATLIPWRMRATQGEFWSADDGIEPEQDRSGEDANGEDAEPTPGEPVLVPVPIVQSTGVVRPGLEPLPIGAACHYLDRISLGASGGCQGGDGECLSR
jgi:hypothetical protein